MATVNEAQKRYLENRERARRLIKLSYPACMDSSAIIEGISQSAKRQAAIKAENDALLQLPEFGLTCPVDTLTGQALHDLEDFSVHLAHYTKQVDNLLSYLIHQRLLESARRRGDLNAQIRESYHCGLTLFYFNRSIAQYGINHATAKVHEYFSFGGSFLDRLEEFPSETQGYIIRSFGNIQFGFPPESSGNEYFPVSEEEVEQRISFCLRLPAVFSDPGLRQKAPDYDWASGLFNVQFAIAYFLRDLREGKRPQLVQPIYECACYIKEHAAQAYRLTDRMVKPKVEYIYNAACFHAGKLSIDSLLDFFFDRIMHADPLRFDSDSIFDNLHCSKYYCAYYNRFAEKTPEGDERERLVSRHMWEYIGRMPPNDYMGVTSYALNVDDHISSLSDQDAVVRQLLFYLRSLHQPTYIHSQMVAILSSLLLEQLIERNPAYITAHGGFSGAAEVNEQRGALLRQIRNCGLLHDIGKLQIIDVISCYSRSLFDMEFEHIADHPYMGYMMLNTFPAIQPFTQPAFGHHRFYNEQGGYPAYYRRTDDLNQLMTDVITVADSVDAATDNIGRCYAKGVSLMELVGQLRAQSGTRYAPFVVELLDDESLLARIADTLHTRRRQIYDEVYREKSMDAEIL